MHRVLLSSIIGMLAAVLVLTPASAAAHRTVTTYAAVGCWVGWEDPYWRPTGRDGQVEHDGAVITTELWVYDGVAWTDVGTEVDTVMDESNAAAGTELYRGSFVVTSTLGDFAGSLVWIDNRGHTDGHGVGRSTDGSGLLWKSTPNVVDPATTGGVPSCAEDREFYNLTELVIVAP
jgi:hypothetical protein